MLATINQKVLMTSQASFSSLWLTKIHEWDRSVEEKTLIGTCVSTCTKIIICVLSALECLTSAVLFSSLFVIAPFGEKTVNALGKRIQSAARSTYQSFAEIFHLPTKKVESARTQRGNGHPFKTILHQSYVTACDCVKAHQSTITVATSIVVAVACASIAYKGYSPFGAIKACLNNRLFSFLGLDTPPIQSPSTQWTLAKFVSIAFIGIVSLCTCNKILQCRTRNSTHSAMSKSVYVNANNNTTPDPVGEMPINSTSTSPPFNTPHLSSGWTSGVSVVDHVKPMCALLGRCFKDCMFECYGHPKDKCDWSVSIAVTVLTVVSGGTLLPALLPVLILRRITDCRKREREMIYE